MSSFKVVDWSYWKKRPRRDGGDRSGLCCLWLPCSWSSSTKIIITYTLLQVNSINGSRWITCARSNEWNDSSRKSLNINRKSSPKHQQWILKLHSHELDSKNIQDTSSNLRNKLKKHLLFDKNIKKGIGIDANIAYIKGYEDCASASEFSFD